MDDATEISAPVCYRHPDRVTGLSCTRCGRSICVECSHDAAVGQLCRECAKPDDRHRVVTRKQIIGRPSFATAPVSMGIIAFTAAIFLIGALHRHDVPEDTLGGKAPDHQTLDEFALLSVRLQHGLTLIAHRAVSYPHLTLPTIDSA